MRKATLIQVGSAIYIPEAALSDWTGDLLPSYRRQVLATLEGFARKRRLQIVADPKVIYHRPGPSPWDPLDQVATLGAKAYARPKWPGFLSRLLIAYYKRFGANQDGRML